MARSETQPKLKLRRLTIDRFRKVPPGTELRFSDGMNVLLGQNATGKTSLLKLISTALRTEFSDIKEEPFAFAYDLELGVARISVRVENRGTTRATGMLPRSKSQTWDFRASLQASYADTGHGAEFAQENRRAQMQFLDRKTETRVSQEYPWWELQRVLELYLAAGTIPPEVRKNDDDLVDQAELVALQWADLVRFDESLEFWKLLLGRDNTYDDEAACLVPLRRAFIPEELYQAIMRRFLGSNEASLTLHSSRLPFLKRICKVLGFQSARVRVELIEHDPSEDTKRIGNLKFWFKERGGGMIPGDRLSFGQKRMFALLYYLELNPDVAIVDEPTNGLHHARIERCMEELGSRQSFVATQNPLWLDYLAFESPEEVRDTFILCRAEPAEEGSVWRWSGMSDDGAQRFFSAYEAGVQFVSEILVAKGLW